MKGMQQACRTHHSRVDVWHWKQSPWGRVQYRIAPLQHFTTTFPQLLNLVPNFNKHLQTPSLEKTSSTLKSTYCEQRAYSTPPHACTVQKQQEASQPCLFDSNPCLQL